jgi:hypothetical protein
VRARVFAAVALTLAGCKDRGPPAPAPVASASASVEPAPSARRPARRYYLTRTAARCEIYFVDPAGSSTPQATPCPLELQVGERIRVAGKTCMREGGDPDRVEPTVCPDPLTNLEKRERGELP